MTTGKRSKDDLDRSSPTTSPRQLERYDGQHADMLGLLALEENIGWQTGGFITQLRFKRQADGWQVMLKASRDGTHKVAFANCRSLSDCFGVVSAWSKRNYWNWRTDKYPS